MIEPRTLSSLVLLAISRIHVLGPPHFISLLPQPSYSIRSYSSQEPRALEHAGMLLGTLGNDRMMQIKSHTTEGKYYIHVSTYLQDEA